MTPADEENVGAGARMPGSGHRIAACRAFRRFRRRRGPAHDNHLMLIDRVDHLIDRVVEFARRPRMRRLRRWSFVVTLPVAGLLIWLRGFQGAAILPVLYVLGLGSVLLLAGRIGGPRGELLLDFVMHPVGRRAFRTELHLVATLARAAGRAARRRTEPTEFSYHRGSSDLGALLALAPAVIIELAVVELLLSGVPLWVRLAIAALSLYGFAWLTAWTLGQRVYPHRLGNDALQAHLGAFYRATVPLNAITSIDITPDRPAKRTELLLSDDTAAFAVGGRVDLRLRLARPVTVHRPLADPARCRSSSSRSTSRRRSRTRSANASTRSVTTDQLRGGEACAGREVSAESLASG